MKVQQMAIDLKITPLELMRLCHENNLKFNSIFPIINDEYIDLFKKKEDLFFKKDDNLHKLKRITVEEKTNTPLDANALKLLEKLHRQNIYGKHKTVLDKYVNLVFNVKEAGKSLSDYDLATLTTDKGAITLNTDKKHYIEEILNNI